MTPEQPGPDEPYEDVGELMKAAGSDMMRLAFRMVRSHADAEDAVQNAFIGVHRNWAIAGQLETAAKQRAYLRQAVLNGCYQIWRDRGRREVPSQQVADVPAAEPDTARHAVARIDLGRLWRAVAELPPACGEVMSLYIAGNNYGEIAEMTGITVSAVRSHMSQARRRLRAVLPDLAGGPRGGGGLT
jgi:RNA polymerase sigma factor (sigma-70 family)